MPSSAEEVEETSFGSEQSGQEFMVEKILAMRRRNGKRQFRIRWKGYGPEEDTWEPEENCDCTELIEEFMRESATSKKASSKSQRGSGAKQNKKQQQQQQQPSNQQQSPSASESVASEAAPSVAGILGDESISSGPQGFDRGLQPEKVVGAAKLDGKLHLLIRWRGSSQPSEVELVPAEQANIRCPELVIAFYESTLAWCLDDDEDAKV